VSGGWRLASGGRVDRGRPLRFTFDGLAHEGLQGDTLASALLANGVITVGRSIAHDRPRGIFAAGVEEPNALVQVVRPRPEPMLVATTVELVGGLEANGLSGRGRLVPDDPRRRDDKRYVHCDLLVVGAGTAGLAATLEAGRRGERVILVDDQPELGGSLLGTRDPLDQVRSAAEELSSLPEVRVLTRTSAAGAYDHGYVVAFERRPGGDHRLWHVRAKRLVLATGAHERPLVFADNDRPGVMLASAARTYVNRYGVRPGSRTLVLTTNDTAYAAAVDVADAGVEVAAILDTRPQAPPAWAGQAAERGIRVLPGHAVTGTSGEERICAARIGLLAEPGGREVACDLLLVSGGWSPVLHLFGQAQGGLRYDPGQAAFVPEAGPRRGRGTPRPYGGPAGDAVRVVGAAAGDGSPAASAHTIWVIPPADGQGWDHHYVDLQRDSTVADVRRATGAGMRSLEHVKRYTTIGTAHDQGRTSGLAAAAVVAEAVGVELAELGTTTFRPPYVPVPFAALAGRERGPLADPVRVTPLHRWHLQQGAVFEDVGQWKRPRYFPRAGEDMDASVMRECRAARTGVAMQDVSTLGKIDVQGPDAATLLDLVYTNLISTLKVGAVRYGLMCRPDGMVFDDGTVLRLAEDRFALTTTTGNAAAVLDWLEEWLQTEWPHLRVYLTSVTEHWATVALVGPRSRELLGAVAPGLPVDRESFPFMTWREAAVAGAPARVCRISFSGELAYEVNVAGWDAITVWTALMEAGRPLAITPYGTETMHVLRAEKGYVIVGQDTDGTVTPHDLGMDWAVSKKKRDFIGRRSFARADTRRGDRKQLVGLLPTDPRELLAEGSQVIAGAEPGPPPVPMLGHVTSSYRSAALDRTFALALVRSGRDRVGDTLHAWSGGRSVPVTVTEPVFYDPEGARRDG
jgi:sarcosine oxidase subunit alpha